MHNIILRFKKRFVDKMMYALMVPRRQLRFIWSKFQIIISTFKANRVEFSKPIYELNSARQRNYFLCLLLIVHHLE